MSAVEDLLDNVPDESFGKKETFHGSISDELFQITSVAIFEDSLDELLATILNYTVIEHC